MANLLTSEFAFEEFEYDLRMRTVSKAVSSHSTQKLRWHSLDTNGWVDALIRKEVYVSKQKQSSLRVRFAIDRFHRLFFL